MRKLIFAINMSLDGCVDHTKTIGSVEMLEHYGHLLREVDLQIFGRKTYEIMVPYWPDVLKDPSEDEASIEFARTFVGLRRVVFSRTLGAVEDEKTRVTDADLREEVLKLKQEPGKDILVGGVDLSSQLIALGLVDEFRIVVQPLLAGAGRRLMEGAELVEKLHLQLVDSKVLASGAVALRYVKA